MCVCVLCCPVTYSNLLASLLPVAPFRTYFPAGACVCCAYRSSYSYIYVAHTHTHTCRACPDRHDVYSLLFSIDESHPHPQISLPLTRHIPTFREREKRRTKNIALVFVERSTVYRSPSCPRPTSRSLLFIHRVRRHRTIFCVCVCVHIYIHI